MICVNLSSDGMQTGASIKAVFVRFFFRFFCFFVLKFASSDKSFQDPKFLHALQEREKAVEIVKEALHNTGNVLRTWVQHFDRKFVSWLKFVDHSTPWPLENKVSHMFLFIHVCLFPSFSYA